MSKSDLIVKEDGEVAIQTGIAATEDRVERIRKLEDLIMSIHNRNQEIRTIFAFNHERGIRLEEMGPYEAPMDYKLNQLDGDIKQLMGIFGLLEEECNLQTRKTSHGGAIKPHSRRLSFSTES